MDLVLVLFLLVYFNSLEEVFFLFQLIFSEQGNVNLVHMKNYFFMFLKQHRMVILIIMNILLKYLIIFIQWDFVFIFQELLQF